MSDDLRAALDELVREPANWNGYGAELHQELLDLLAKHPAEPVPAIRAQVAEEIAQALEAFAANDIRGRADMSIDRAAAIARETGEHSSNPREDG